MSEAITGIFVLVTLSTLSAAAIFSFIRSFWAAEIISVILSAALFQVAAYFHVGYLDPFWEVATVLSAPAVAIICAIVGGLVRAFQSRQASMHRGVS